MARNLQVPSRPNRNVHIYDNDGNVIGGMEIRQQPRYISSNMLYRYCEVFIRFPAGVRWAVFHLQRDGSTGRKLRRGDNMITTGNYVILDPNGGPIDVTLTSERAPRCIYSRSPTSSQIASNRTTFQQHFHDGLRERENMLCAISGRPFRTQDGNLLEAAHIFPVSKVIEWRANNYRGRWIFDTSNESQISATGLYSLQNGLLLGDHIHHRWDGFTIAVDPDVCPGLLRWHLRMCILRNMKGDTGEPQ
ncbi:hypothetical protein B7463_g8447, partial [Scytalidium lignicola]